jgi:O-antigen/teichoic acid export membrane protein
MVVYVLATERAPFADSILVAAAMTVIMLGQSQIETVTTRLQLVVLNILLTPSFGLNGAAASVVVADLLLLLFLAWGAGRHIDGIAAWSSFRPSTLRQSLDYIGNSRGASH